MNVIIVGGGQTGSYIARLLLSQDFTVKIIENRPIALDKLKAEFPAFVIHAGSGTNPKDLEEAGILQADVLVAVTGADEANLVTCTLAKMEFNVPRVIGRVNNPKNDWLYNAGMGVDVKVNQADLMAHMVVSDMDLKEMMTLVKLNDGNFSISQISIDEHSKVIDRKVRDLVMPLNTLLVAISRGAETIIPNGESVFQAGDIILAMADDANREAVHSLFI